MGSERASWLTFPFHAVPLPLLPLLFRSKIALVVATLPCSLRFLWEEDFFPEESGSGESEEEHEGADEGADKGANEEEDENKDGDEDDGDDEEEHGRLQFKSGGLIGNNDTPFRAVLSKVERAWVTFPFHALPLLVLLTSLVFRSKISLAIATLPCALLFPEDRDSFPENNGSNVGGFPNKEEDEEECVSEDEDDSEDEESDKVEEEDDGDDRDEDDGDDRDEDEEDDREEEYEDERVNDENEDDDEVESKDDGDGDDEDGDDEDGDDKERDEVEVLDERCSVSIFTITSFRPPSPPSVPLLRGRGGITLTSLLVVASHLSSVKENALGYRLVRKASMR